MILADEARWNFKGDSLRALILVSQLCEVVSSAAANDASSNYDNLFIHPREENKILKTKDLLTLNNISSDMHE